MISGSCHCGSVQIEIPRVPEVVTECNCSLCRRYGALWAYYAVDTVKVIGHPENTTGYIWGDKTLSTVRCKSCGCVTHWEPLEGKSEGRMAVNIRNFEPEIMKTVKIRHFDGADTWTFIEQKSENK